MIVKIDQTRMFVRWLRYFKSVADADGFAAYDLRYLNGARVYAGLWSYGNVSVRSYVRSFGELSVRLIMISFDFKLLRVAV
jgi:hypothetical protein